jgi:hypothetical protein
MACVRKEHGRNRGRTYVLEAYMTCTSIFEITLQIRGIDADLTQHRWYHGRTIPKHDKNT